MSLVKLDVRTTTDQVLYVEPSSLRIYATPLGVDPATVPVDKTSLLPVDTKSILAAGVVASSAAAVPAPLATPQPVVAKKKKKKTPVKRLKESPFQEASGRLRVAIYN